MSESANQPRVTPGVAAFIATLISVPLSFIGVTAAFTYGRDVDNPMGGAIYSGMILGLWLPFAGAVGFLLAPQLYRLSTSGKRGAIAIPIAFHCAVIVSIRLAFFAMQSPAFLTCPKILYQGL